MFDQLMQLPGGVVWVIALARVDGNVASRVASQHVSLTFLKCLHTIALAGEDVLI